MSKSHFTYPRTNVISIKNERDKRKSNAGKWFSPQPQHMLLPYSPSASLRKCVCASKYREFLASTLGTPHSMDKITNGGSYTMSISK